MGKVTHRGSVSKYQQEQDAHRCDRVKVLHYTNSLRAFLLEINFRAYVPLYTMCVTHYQIALALPGWCHDLAFSYQ